MRLRSRVAKIQRKGPHRELPVEVTYERMTPHLRRVGITRVADITGLDRVGIPVYNAICPRSADVISVYNGKGATQLDAKTSAIMEAVERFSAALPLSPAAVASYSELQTEGRLALDPRTFNFQLHPQYDLAMPISWVKGQDLMNDEPVLVPLFLAGYYALFHEVPCYALATSNGLASGNSLEEAIYHALCELIERDDWTMADLVCNRLSRAISAGRLGPRASGPSAAWLQELHPNIDLDTLPVRARSLVNQFQQVGLRVELKDLTSATGIPSILANVFEDIAPTFSQGHMGLGTHPDAEVAVTRAISEVAQSRVVDINALREDINLPNVKVPKYLYHVQRSGRVNREAWPYKRSLNSVRLEDMPSHPSEDVMEDVRLMLDRLRSRGLAQAIVVDLSPPGIPASVVRLIVPGLESWIVDRSKMGPRAAAKWQSMLSLLSSARVVAEAS